MGGGFRDDHDGGMNSGHAAPLNYVKFDIQAILAWASAARSNADRSEIVEEYAHNNVVNRRVVLHQMARDYKSLGSMELKRNAGKNLLVRNPQFCSEGVSNKLVTTASNTVRKEWAKQRRYTTLGCDIDNMSFVRILNESLARRNYSITKEIQARGDPDFPITEETLERRYEAACVTNLSNPYRYLYQPDSVYGGRHGTDFLPQNIPSREGGMNIDPRGRKGDNNILSLPEFSIPKKDQRDIKKILINEVSVLSSKTQDAPGTDMDNDDDDDDCHRNDRPPMPSSNTEEPVDMQTLASNDIFRKSSSEFFMTTVVDLFSAISAKVEKEFMDGFVYPFAETARVDMYAYDEARPRVGETLSQLQFAGKKPLGTPTFAYFDDVVTAQRRLSVNCIVALPCKLARVVEESGDGSEGLHRSVAAIFDGSDISRGGCAEHNKCMNHISKKDILLFRVTLDIRDVDMDITKGEFSTDTLTIEYSPTVDNRLGTDSRFGDALFTMNMMSMGYIIRSIYTQYKVSRWLKRKEKQETAATEASAGSSPAQLASCKLPFLRKPCEHKEGQDGDNGVVGLIQGYMMKL